MKKLFLITFLFLSIACLAQTRKPKPRPKAKAAPPALTDIAVSMIPKGNLVAAKSLKEVIIVPKGCKISGFKLSCTQLGSYHEFVCKNGNLTPEIMNLFKKGHANQLYVFEQIKASCKLKKRFEVVIKP